MWPTTESEYLMDVPGLASLRQAAATPVCRYGGYECRTARYIFHTRVVGVAMPQYFMLCHVIDSGNTTHDIYTHSLSSYYYGLAHFTSLRHVRCYRHMCLTTSTYST